LWGCTTLKIGKPSTVFFVSFREHLKKNFLDRPRITPLYTSRLSWVLIPGHCEKGVDQPMKAWAGALQWPGISHCWLWE